MKAAERGHSAQAAPEAFIPTEEYDLELELSEMTEAFVDAFSGHAADGVRKSAPVFCVRGVHNGRANHRQRRRASADEACAGR
ncbi:MAG: hypothetical protein ACLUI3_09710 [Christensenellales bacterium]